MIKNVFKHLNLIMKHKWQVFKFTCKIGIPLRGILHDLSKFSPTEFIEGVKFYTGDRSPILECKQKNGYSKAWLHHRGRNKHHYEYWIDLTAPEKFPMVPYKYVAEMICDKLAASVTYNGKNWNNSSMLEYWNVEKKHVPMNKKVEEMLTEVFEQVSREGIDKTLTKSNIKRLYKSLEMGITEINREELNENKI